MSWTQEDLNALNKAIANGAKSVSYRDRKVEYRDLTEMLEIKSKIESSLGSTKKATRVYATTSTGL